MAGPVPLTLRRKTREEPPCRLCSAAAAAPCWPAPASSPLPPWPAPRPGGPITVVVPNPPGGGTDFAARLYQDALTRTLGTQVVVENKPGANGNIAILAVARAAPDGQRCCCSTAATTPATRP